MGLANVDGVFGSEQLIGSNKPHILFDHEVLNNASGGEGKTITTMHQHSLPLLRGGINALIDVLKAAVLEGEAFLDGVWKVAHVHFEPRPTMLDTPWTSARNDPQTSLPRQAAHVDDAIDVISAQRTSAISRIQVAHVNVVCNLGYDRIWVLEVFRDALLGFWSLWARLGTAGNCSATIVAHFLGSGAGRGVRVRLRAAVPRRGEEWKATRGLALGEVLHRAGETRAGGGGGARSAKERRSFQGACAAGCSSTMGLLHLTKKIHTIKKGVQTSFFATSYEQLTWKYFHLPELWGCSSIPGSPEL